MMVVNDPGKFLAEKISWAWFCPGFCWVGDASFPHCLRITGDVARKRVLWDRHVLCWSGEAARKREVRLIQRSLRSHEAHENMARWWQLKHFWNFHPYLGEDFQFDEHIFQMGWFNHQLDGWFVGFFLVKIHWPPKNEHDMMENPPFFHLGIASPNGGFSRCHVSLFWGVMACMRMYIYIHMYMICML